MPFTEEATPVFPLEPVPTGHDTDLPCPTAVFHEVLDGAKVACEDECCS